MQGCLIDETKIPRKDQMPNNRVLCIIAELGNEAQPRCHCGIAKDGPLNNFYEWSAILPF